MVSRAPSDSETSLVEVRRAGSSIGSLEHGQNVFAATMFGGLGSPAEDDSGAGPPRAVTLPSPPPWHSPG